MERSPSSKNESDNWKVIITKPYKENLVFKDLISLGFETYLPLNRFLMFWGEKQKWIIKPIFPGIIFSKFSNDQESEILNISTVKSVLKKGRELVGISCEDINFIKKVIGLKENFEIRKFKISKGKDVDIVDGPLKNMQVKIIKYSGHEKAAITLPQINYTILIDLDSRLFKYEEQKEFYQKIWNH